MKTLSTLASALLIIALGNPVLSRSRPEQASQGEQKPKPINLKGTVKSDGTKLHLSPTTLEKPGTQSIRRP